MIFKDVNSEATKVGNIKSNSVSIDAANLDFIINIISSGLYSKPIESFVREIVSNAWDAHVEAGNNSPIALELGLNTEGQYFCKIQDFGVGLSPERFNSVYKNIGSSTKRGTNGQIGGFGIGRFSALSYSNVVRIISVFDGTEYMYLMYKDNNKLSIDLLYSKPTELPNGVSVEIDVKNHDVDKFVEAIKIQLSYFDNLVVIESIPNKPYGIENKFNDSNIKKYKNFCANTFDSHINRTVSILLGKVQYPLRFTSLNKFYDSFIKNYPIALNFEIGDLGVTPNREELLYNADSIGKIETALDASILEIENLFATQNKKNYTDFKEFAESIGVSEKVVLVSNDTDLVSIKKSNMQEYKMLNGVKYNTAQFSNHLDTFSSLNLSKNSYALLNNKLINKNGYNLNTTHAANRNGLYVCNVAKLSNHSKSYLRETFSNNTIFIKPIKSYEVFKFIIKATKKNSRDLKTFQRNDTHNPLIVKEIIKYYAEAYNKLPRFDDSQVPVQFIVDRKAKLKNRKVINVKSKDYWKQYISINVVTSNRYGNYAGMDTENYKLGDLKKEFKKLSVYTFKGDTRTSDMCVVFKKVNFIEVAPTKMKLIENLDNFVKLDDFMDKKYKAIRDLGTVMYIKDHFPELGKLYSMKNINLISNNLYTVITSLHEFVSATANNYDDNAVANEVYEYCKEQNAFNEEIKGLYTKHKRHLDNAKSLIPFVYTTGLGHDIHGSLLNLVTDYVLAKKLFTPSMEAVNRLKKETIFNNK
jgi:hypothetical protein